MERDQLAPEVTAACGPAHLFLKRPDWMEEVGVKHQPRNPENTAGQASIG